MDKIRNSMREFLETVPDEAESNYFVKRYGLTIAPTDTRKDILDKRLLQLAETDPEAAEMAKKWGLLSE